MNSQIQLWRLLIKRIAFSGFDGDLLRQAGGIQDTLSALMGYFFAKRSSALSDLQGPEKLVFPTRAYTQQYDFGGSLPKHCQPTRSFNISSPQASIVPDLLWSFLIQLRYNMLQNDMGIHFSGRHKHVHYLFDQTP